VEVSWLDEQRPVGWQDFEEACAAGKEILERLAGDRTLLRRLAFTADERAGLREAGVWAGSGGELELFGDESRGIFLYLHVGLTQHEGGEAPLSASYVAKVLSGKYRHVWRDDVDVAYATDEQPPGLYGIRRELTHSLSWDDHSTCLVLREARTVDPQAGGLSEDQYLTLQNRADFAGIL
jgi:hypothetical protein